MAKAVKFSREFAENGVTVIDNAFISAYMPSAPADAVKVYLYGLLSSGGDNSIEDMALELGLDIAEIIEYYGYWSDWGLVRIISDTPFMVEYLPVTNGNRYLKKYKPEKYDTFTKELQELFHEQHLTPNKLLGFIEIIEDYKMQPDAMLMIAKYCIDFKGERVHTNYILTVAREWANNGILTVKDVDTRLMDIELNNEKMREVFAALKLKTAPALEDKEKYIKWTRSWGYDHESIVFAAGSVKRGGMAKLDAALDSFYRKGIFTLEAIRENREYVERARGTAYEVLKNLGLYYDNVEPVVDVYVSEWFDKGFDPESLALLAKYAFKRGVKSLDQFNGIIAKFYKLGFVTADGINEYIAASVERDRKIKTLIEAGGPLRRVTEQDRQYYETWTEVWGFDDGVLELAAKISMGKAHPFAFMNGVLARWKNEGVDSVERAEAMAVSVQSKGGAEKGAADKKFGTAREYTKEELDGVFGGDDLDKILETL